MFTRFQSCFFLRGFSRFQIHPHTWRGLRNHYLYPLYFLRPREQRWLGGSFGGREPSATTEGCTLLRKCWSPVLSLLLAILATGGAGC